MELKQYSISTEANLTKIMFFIKLKTINKPVFEVIEVMKKNWSFGYHGHAKIKVGLYLTVSFQYTN